MSMLAAAASITSWTRGLSRRPYVSKEDCISCNGKIFEDETLMDDEEAPMCTTCYIKQKRGIARAIKAR